MIRNIAEFHEFLKTMHRIVVAIHLEDQCIALYWRDNSGLIIEQWLTIETISGITNFKDEPIQILDAHDSITVQMLMKQFDRARFLQGIERQSRYSDLVDSDEHCILLRNILADEYNVKLSYYDETPGFIDFEVRDAGQS